MIDTMPPWFAVTLAVIFLAWWLAIEYRDALPDPYPDEPSNLDVLQMTGKYPHENVAAGSGRRSNRHPRSCGGVR